MAETLADDLRVYPFLHKLRRMRVPQIVEAKTLESGTPHQTDNSGERVGRPRTAIQLGKHQIIILIGRSEQQLLLRLLRSMALEFIDDDSGRINGTATSSRLRLLE